MKEIQKCLKRYIACELYPMIWKDFSFMTQMLRWGVNTAVENTPSIR